MSIKINNKEYFDEYVKCGYLLDCREEKIAKEIYDEVFDEITNINDYESLTVFRSDIYEGGNAQYYYEQRCHEKFLDLPHAFEGYRYKLYIFATLYFKEESNKKELYRINFTEPDTKTDIDKYFGCTYSVTHSFEELEARIRRATAFKKIMEALERKR